MLDSATANLAVLVLLGYAFAVAEGVPGLGILLPGELSIVALSSVCADSQETLVLLLAVTLGAVTADHGGYGLGRRFGRRTRTWPVLRRVDVGRWDSAESSVRRRGAVALLGSRMVPVVRTLVPVIAGVARLRYRSLLVGSLAGSTMWAGVWITGGAALRAAAVTAGPWPLVAGLAALLTLSAVLLIRRPHGLARQPRASSQDAPACS